MAVWSGLDTFREQLMRLPEDLRQEAADIISHETEQARSEIDADYAQHTYTGNLRARLLLSTLYEGRFGVRTELRNKAHHAWLYDNGSEARHYVTPGGAIHETGKMWGRTPPRHTFVRAAIQARERIEDGLRAMMESHGLEVSSG